MTKIVFIYRYLDEDLVKETDSRRASSLIVVKTSQKKSILPLKVLSPLQNDTGDLYNVVHNNANSNYWPLQALL